MGVSHNELIIIDGHQDLAYNAVSHGRDLRRSVLATRELEKGGSVPARAGQCMLGLPDLLAGNVAIVFGTVFALPAHRALSGADIFTIAPTRRIARPWPNWTSTTAGPTTSRRSP